MGKKAKAAKSAQTAVVPPVAQASARRASSDPKGFRVRASFGYEAAGSDRRLSNWNAPALGPNSLLFSSLDRLRDRSNDLIRQNPYAGSIVDKWVSNAIGTGIDLQWRHPKKSVRENLKKLWKRSWAFADFDGRTDLGGLQAQGFRTMVVSGEGLGRYRQMDFDQARRMQLVPLQLELIEPDHLPTMGPIDSKPEGGNQIRCGIELNEDGRRIAYHLYREHPNESFLVGTSLSTVRVPIAQVMHVFRGMRPKQLRGEPWFVRVMVRLLSIDKYDDAELARKNFAASLTAFVKSSASDDARPLVGTGNEPAAASGQQSVEVEPGTVIDLGPDEEIEIADIDDVGGMYGEFLRVQLRAICAGVGLPYEMVTGDLSQVNYSSIRAGSLEFRRLCEQIQYATFIPQFCEEYKRRWLESAALIGAIDIQDFLANRADYEDVEWITPGWDWVDPLKDITARLMAIGGGLDSRRLAVTARGLDLERIDQDNAEDKKWQKANGVQYGSPKSKQANKQMALALIAAGEDEQPKRSKEIVQ